MGGLGSDEGLDGMDDTGLWRFGGLMDGEPRGELPSGTW